MLSSSKDSFFTKRIKNEFDLPFFRTSSLNTVTAMLLFLLGSFALIIAFVETPSIQYYTGGVIIGLFMAGIFFTYGNSIRQARRLEEMQKEELKPATSPDAGSAEPSSH